MSYEITIKETKTKKEVVTEYQILGEKEVTRNSQFYNRAEEEPKTKIDKVYGYAAPVEKQTTSQVEIFKQVVEQLDLTEVIKAINLIK